MNLRLRISHYKVKNVLQRNLGVLNGIQILMFEEVDNCLNVMGKNDPFIDQKIIELKNS